MSDGIRRVFLSQNRLNHLTADAIALIRQSRRSTSQRDLAKHFGITVRDVGRIQRTSAPEIVGQLVEKCYACGLAFRKNSYGRIVFHPEVLTIDGQRQFVGHDCYKHILAAGKDGYQPSLGGPRLFTELNAPADALKAAGITITYGEAR